MIKEMENKDRFAYCGIDCDACNKHSKEIREGAIKLKAGLDEKIGVAGAEKIRSRIFELKNYEEFYGVLEWFATQEGIMNNGDCVKCRNGGGRAICEIRDCAKEKGIEFCCKCEDYPCDLLHPKMIEEGNRLISNKKMQSKKRIKEYLRGLEVGSYDKIIKFLSAFCRKGSCTSIECSLIWAGT